MARPRIKFNAPVVLGFVALCVAERVLSQLTGGASTYQYFMTYRGPLNDPLTYLRMLTHVLGHSGWEHLMSNMGYVLLLGPLLEEKYGSKRLAAIMVVTALACGVANYLLSDSTALCGASGICFAFILLASFTDRADGEIPLTFILVAALYLTQQVMDGLLLADNVSNLSHVIGGVIGAIAGFALTGGGARKAA